MTSTINTSFPSPVQVHGERTEMPRPLRRLPELPAPAVIRELRAAAKKALGMSDRAAGAMSTIWVHPEAILPQIEQPRRMRIPGGHLLYLDGLVWTPRLMADPLNPRNADRYFYPLAGGEAISHDESLVANVESLSGELVMTAPSPRELLHALEVAMDKTRKSNDPNPPIRDQGIMDAPFGVMTVLNFSDGSTDIAVPLVREGSSRTSHAHDALGLEPEDTVLRMPASSKAMTEFIADINSIVSRPADEVDEDDRARVRCATTNFLLIVGFEPDTPGTLDLAAAIKIKVAQEHLNTKQDWTDAAQNSTMADDCLQAAYRGGLLKSSADYNWLLGRLTHEEAVEVGLAEHFDDRFARLMWMFTTADPQVHDVIRRPIAFVLRQEKKSDNARVRVTSKTKVPLAAELVAREFRGHPDYPDTDVDRIVKVIQNGAAITKHAWSVQHTSLTALEKDAQAELASAGVPGASCAELAVRALYYGAVWDDVFRIARNDQGAGSDRRSVADLIEAMMGTSAGITQLASIVRDGRADQQPIEVDADGEPVIAGDGGPVPLTNQRLRYVLFPKGGSAKKPGKGPEGGPNPEPQPEPDPYVEAQETIDKALRELTDFFEYLEDQVDDSGAPLVESQGLTAAQAKRWRKTLGSLLQKVNEW
ncbi:hypothetical protein [Actinoplanes sp. M2I2]|uniref:hypothetical protein n=1 Tax=Actinoplanes sp. M2I2 TaxID=1734444 RepID=UPI002022663B|nr:hypothetical protein [Actinoplanes sp. M2I2]